MNRFASRSTGARTSGSRPRLLATRNESSQRVRPACRYFGVCGGCKMQHLHVAAQVATKQRALEDALWHLGKVEAGATAAADRGAGLGLSLSSPLVGAPRYQEGQGADRLSRAQVELCGRHGELRGVAAASECAAGAAARSDRRNGSARSRAADRGGDRRRRDGPGAAPPRAAGPGRSGAAARLRHSARHSVVVAGERARHASVCSTKAGRRWPTRCPNSASRCRSGRPISRRSTLRSTGRWSAGRCGCSTSCLVRR